MGEQVGGFVVHRYKELARLPGGSHQGTTLNLPALGSDRDLGTRSNAESVRVLRIDFHIQFQRREFSQHRRLLGSCLRVPLRGGTPARE